MGGDFFLEWRYTTVVRAGPAGIPQCPAEHGGRPVGSRRARAAQTSECQAGKSPGAPEGLENA
jgi:hypothetical protein